MIPGDCACYQVELCPASAAPLRRRCDLPEQFAALFLLTGRHQGGGVAVFQFVVGPLPGNPPKSVECLQHCVLVKLACRISIAGEFRRLLSDYLSSDVESFALIALLKLRSLY